MKAQKRLLVMAPASSIHTYHWLRSLGPEWDICLLSLHVPNEKVSGLKNVQTKILKPKFSGKFGYLFCIPDIRKFIHQWKPDLIQAHYLSSYGLLCALSDDQNRPKILTIWGSDLSHRAQIPVFGGWLKKVMRRFSHVLTPSEGFRQQVIATGVRAEKVTVLQYGLDLSKCSFKKSSQPGHIVISPRNWNELYQIPAVIKGFQAFLKLQPDAQLWLCGSGTPEEVDRIESLCSHTKQIKIFGKIAQEALFDLYAKAHVLISLPLSDGRSQSVIEGVANGCRPILSDLKANREIAGSDGIYPIDLMPEHVAQALSRAFEPWDPTSLFKKISSENDHQVMIQRLYEIYDSVLRDPSASR